MSNNSFTVTHNYSDFVAAPNKNPRIPQNIPQALRLDHQPGKVRYWHEDPAPSDALKPANLHHVAITS